MAQDNYVISTTESNTGLTVIEKINEALAAAVTNNAGNSEPPVKYPLMWWPDIPNDLLKIRNATNTAWVDMFKISTGQAVSAALVDMGPINAAQTAAANSATSAANSASAAAISAATPLFKAYNTLALATADLTNIPANALIWVNADTTAANIGYWAKIGGVLVQSAFDRVALVENRSTAVEARATSLETKTSSMENNLLTDLVKGLEPGTYIAARALASTFAGYASAVNYAAQKFQAVKLYLQIEDEIVDVRVSILTPTLTTITSAIRSVTRSGYHLFVFPVQLTPSLITTSAFYLAFESVGHTKRLRNCDIAITTDKALVATYPEKYTTTALAEGTWNTVGGEVNGLAATFYDFDPLVTYALSDLRSDLTWLKNGLATIDTVTASAKTAAYAAVNVSAGYRALSFSGYGAKFTTPGTVSFNMIRLPLVGRTATPTKLWHTIYVEVRNTDSVGTILATGSVRVCDTLNLLQGVEILLRDPTTLALKTLNQTNFGATYFIGYYAKDVNGAYADCGEGFGTISNFASVSYYKHGVTGAWNSYSGNPQIAIETWLATSPVASTATVLIPTSVQAGSVGHTQCDPIVQANLLPSIDLLLPPNIYAIVGREMSVYFDNILSGDIPAINWDCTCTVGIQQTERWMLNAVGTTTTTLTIDARLLKNKEPIFATTSTSLTVVATSAGTGVNRKCLFIGDSVTANGYYIRELLNLFGAGDPMDITLMGTQLSAPYQGLWNVGVPYATNDLVLHPAGYGLWYAKAPSTGVTPVEGASWTQTVPTQAALAGSIVKHEGRGGWDTDKYYTDVTSPFVFTGSFSFSSYMAANSYTAPDWVFLALGINDIFHLFDDAAVIAKTTAAMAQWESMFANIHAYDSNIKIGVMITIPPTANQDAFGANYTSEQTRWRYRRNLSIWNRQVINQFKNRTAGKIYLVPMNCNMDTVNGMWTSVAATPVNSRSLVMVNRQTNGVHPPPNEASLQMADTLHAFLKAQG